MKVTPEIIAPIIANDTTGHGARRLPVKKVSLSLPREAINDTLSSSAKYAIIAIMTMTGVDISVLN
jgi:hypothetical protein